MIIEKPLRNNGLQEMLESRIPVTLSTDARGHSKVVYVLLHFIFDKAFPP